MVSVGFIHIWCDCIRNQYDDEEDIQNLFDDAGPGEYDILRHRKREETARKAEEEAKKAKEEAEAAAKLLEAEAEAEEKDKEDTGNKEDLDSEQA